MVTPVNAPFGPLLRHYRLAAHLTQEELAARANISVRTISDLERGLNQGPRRITLQLLADALQLSEQDRTVLETAGGRRGGPAVPPPLASPVQTFLMADIRGYTAFTHAQGDEAAARLTSRFAGLVEEVIARWGAELIELRGDEALVGFGSARGALRAALELQHVFEGETERDPSLPLRVGMGLDAGEAVPVEGGYRGGALNLAARLCSLAGPGEVFASEAVIHLARSMEELTYVDCGVVELKGLPEPVRVVQVVREGSLPADVPPFGLQRRGHTRVPLQPTRFIGREEQVAELCALLGRKAVRLLTLTGAGGTGKTRLAVEVAGHMAQRFPDGIAFVNLASLVDPALVAPTIAGTLELEEVAGRPILDTLSRHLQGRQLLLILDNFEHLLSAVDAVSQLLVECPQLTILVTSRAALHLSAEHEYPVPTMALVDPKHLPDLASLSQCEAVALFIERAQAIKPRFGLTSDNAPTVAEICCRLEGLPLALELAAARVKVLPLSGLLARLEHRLQLLTAGPRDLPARQQTMRDAIAWSYDLLDEEEQRLFRRLAVFVGGCTLEAAEAICDADGSFPFEVFDGLSSLVDNSLLRAEEQAPRGYPEPRFRMLETVREYAVERLRESGEGETVQRRHAQYFLALAEKAEAELTGPDQIAWLRLLEQEHDNLRAALSWARESRRAEQSLRLAGALWRFWSARGHLSEGRRWLQQGLSESVSGDDATSSARTKALVGAAMLAIDQGAFDEAEKCCAQSTALSREREQKRNLILSLNAQGLLARLQFRYADVVVCYEEALALARVVGDRLGEAEALSGLSFLGFREDPARGQALAEQSLALFRETGHTRGMADVLHNLAGRLSLSGDYGRAEALEEEALTLFRALGDTGETAQALFILGMSAERQGHYERAATLLEESLALRRERGDERNVPVTLATLALVALNQGDLAQARTLMTNARMTIDRYDDPWGQAIVLTALGHLELSAGDAERAQMLLGDSARLYQAIESTYQLPWCLEGLAGVAAARGHWEQAARLCGARDALLERTGSSGPPLYLAGYAHTLAAVRQELGEQREAEARQQGAALPLGQLIADTLESSFPSFEL